MFATFFAFTVSTPFNRCHFRVLIIRFDDAREVPVIEWEQNTGDILSSFILSFSECRVFLLSYINTIYCFLHELQVFAVAAILLELVCCRTEYYVRKATAALDYYVRALHIRFCTSLLYAMTLTILFILIPNFTSYRPGDCQNVDNRANCLCTGCRCHLVTRMSSHVSEVFGAFFCMCIQICISDLWVHSRL